MEKSIIEIPVIDPNSPYSKKRKFRIAPLTPLLRRRLFWWLHDDVLLNAKKPYTERFKSLNIDISDSAEVLSDFLLYLEETGQIEKLLAHLIIPEGETQADIDEIAEFLEKNAMPSKEAEIITAFFTSTAVADMAMAIAFIRKKMKKTLKNQQEKS